MSSDKTDIELQVSTFEDRCDVTLEPSYDYFNPQNIKYVKCNLKLPPKSTESCRTCTLKLVSQASWDGIDCSDGNLIVCNSNYLAYVIHSKTCGYYVVKVKDRDSKSNLHVVINEVDADIVSLEFMSPYDDILAFVDRNGTLYIVKICKLYEDTTSKLKASILCKFVIPNEENFSIFKNRKFKLSWLPWKYKLNFENKLLPYPSDNQMLLLYSNNGCCIIYKFKIDIVGMQNEYVNISDENVVDCMFMSNLHESIITSAYISFDGDFISTSSFDGKFKIWKINVNSENRLHIYTNMEPQYEFVPFENNDSIIMHHWCDTRMFSSQDKISFWSILIVVSAHNTIKLYDSSNFSLIQTINLELLVHDIVLPEKELILRPLTQSFGTMLIFSTNYNYLLIFDITMKVTPDNSDSPDGFAANKWKFIFPLIIYVSTMPIKCDILDFVLYPETYINKHLVGDGMFKCTNQKVLNLFSLCKKNIYSMEFFLQKNDDNSSKYLIKNDYWNNSKYSYNSGNNDTELDLIQYECPGYYANMAGSTPQTHLNPSKIMLSTLEKVTLPHKEIIEDSHNSFSGKVPCKNLFFENTTINNDINVTLNEYNSDLFHTALAEISNNSPKNSNTLSNNYHDDQMIMSDTCITTSKKNVPLVNSKDTSYNQIHNLLSEDSLDPMICANNINQQDPVDLYNNMRHGKKTLSPFSNQKSSNLINDSQIAKLFDSRFDNLEQNLKNSLEKMERRIDDTKLKKIPNNFVDRFHSISASMSSDAMDPKTTSMNQKNLNDRITSLENLVGTLINNQAQHSKDTTTRMSREIDSSVVIQLSAMKNDITQLIANKLENVFQNIFTEIDYTFRDGTQKYLNAVKDYLKAYEKNLTDKLELNYTNQIEYCMDNAIQSHLCLFKKELTKQLKETIESLNHQQTNVIRQLLMESQKILKNDTSLSSDMFSNSIFSKIHKIHSQSPLDEAKHFAENGELVKALSICLQHNYKDFCLQLCLSQEPQTLVRNSKRSLSMNELYQLVKILSKDLTVNQNQKIAYLQEILLIFDVAGHRNDVGFIECMEMLIASFESHRSYFDKSTQQIVRMLSLICRRFLV